MATKQALTNITKPSNADLSAGQYKFVVVNSSGKVAIVASAGGEGIGVLQNDPAAADRDAVVAISGISIVLAGGTVAAGARVQSDANGAAITASTSDVCLGVCMSGGASGEYIEVLLNAPHIMAA